MKYYPDKWDSSVGEHSEIGESYEESAKRGLKEELHVEINKLEFLGKKAIKEQTGHEMIGIFKTVFDKEIRPDKEEVAEGKFFTFKEIQKLVKEKKTTPFFNEFFKVYKNEFKNTKNRP